MPALGHELTIRLFDPNDAVTIQPEEGHKSCTCDTGVEQESAAELPGSPSSCEGWMTAEFPSNHQQSDSVSDKSTDISAESGFISTGEPNYKPTLEAECDKSLVRYITPAAVSTFNDTSLGDVSQAHPDVDNCLSDSTCHVESRNRSVGSTSNQLPLIPGVQATKCVDSDNIEPGQVLLGITRKDNGFEIVVMDKETEQTEQTTKPQRNSPRNAAKRSFQDFIANDSLFIADEEIMKRAKVFKNIQEDADEVQRLSDYLLAVTEETIKKTGIIKRQLIESQKHIRRLWR